MYTKTKVIAAYLPQFHRTPYNDEWWGDGFTDWDGVKKAKPLYDGHNQPRVPLNHDYYSLDDPVVIKKQAELARQYGVYGFGIYHYWMSSDIQLLTKPAKIILDNKDININFLFIWDNVSWTRTWSAIKHQTNTYAPAFDGEKKDSNDKGILAELKYGDKEEWKKHFEYLLPFFKDDRYIKHDGKPVFCINKPDNDSETIVKMCEYMDKLSLEYGFKGIEFVANKTYRNVKLDSQYIFQPLSTHTFLKKGLSYLHNIYVKRTKKLSVYDYDKEWNSILKDAEKYANDDVYYSGFVRFDDTPRRGNMARIIQNDSPEKFKKYFRKLMALAKKNQKEYIFLFAWNEWGEGNYLEPDEENKYKYLKALSEAINEY